MKFNILRLKSLYSQFQNDEYFKQRITQLPVAPLFKGIIQETLNNEPFINTHLTGLIQMFKQDVSTSTFQKYLKINISDELINQQFFNKYKDLGLSGYALAGLQSIWKLSQEELDQTKSFLAKAFTITTIEDAVVLCRDFDSLKIPFITKGIYSPWLHYINPFIFPFLNNSHTPFLNYLGIANNYPDCIIAFNELKTQLGIQDLGQLDAFAHKFNDDASAAPISYNINGKRLFKISHGILAKRAKNRNNNIIQLLFENNWIAINKYTRRNQSIVFHDIAAVGDLVYLCYGGDKVEYIAEITSEVKNFSAEVDELFDDERDEWVYREVKPLFLPIQHDIQDLKNYRKAVMPSGNTTFWQAYPYQFADLNEHFFTPKFNVSITNQETTLTHNPIEIQPISNMSKNIILYGPPGTGKTYHSIFHSVAIIEGKRVEEVEKEDIKIVKPRFDNYISANKIVFTTFHQSLSYEDFIEGIKPQESEDIGAGIIYPIVDGIFKTLCTDAAFSMANGQQTEAVKRVYDFGRAWENYLNNVNEQLEKGEKVALSTKSGGNVYIKEISSQGNLKVEHNNSNNGYTVSKSRLSKLDQAFPELEEIDNIYEGFTKTIGGMNASAYWAVLNAIRQTDFSTAKSGQELISPLIPFKEDVKEYDYQTKKELISEVDIKVYENNHQPYVLIIDEINRGNIAQIFGELITLIEDDKRLGSTTTLTVTLPYSREKFGVPPNLYIIGTMNTADRSVEALDTALRRRFSFIPYLPNPSKLFNTVDADINLPSMLTIINTRLSILKDKDHTIGHAWLTKVKTFEDLKAVFGNKILPLLQEYFFNDYEKIGLVLGERFFRNYSQISSSVFAKFSGSESLAAMYNDSRQFVLKAIDELTVEDFQSIYS